MSKIATLSQRALAKAGSVLEKVIPDDVDKAERLGEKIKNIVGQKAFDKIESFADAAMDELDNRRIQNEKDPDRRAMMQRQTLMRQTLMMRDPRNGRGL